QNTALLGGTMEVASGGSANVLFGLTDDGLYDTASKLVLDASTSFHGTVAGFGLGGKADQIDLRDIAFNPTAKKSQLSYNALSGTLTVTDGAHTAVLHMSYMGAPLFSASSDGAGGMLITYSTSQPVTTGNGHGHGNTIA